MTIESDEFQRLLLAWYETKNFAGQEYENLVVHVDEKVKQSMADEKSLLKIAEIVCPPENENGFFGGSLVEAVQAVQDEMDRLKTELAECNIWLQVTKNARDFLAKVLECN